MRLFLGVSFLWAGLDKLTDPSFLNPSSPTYIGQQITHMADGSPIGGFLLNVAGPNAGLFGVMVMGGEICIGIAVLLGLLTRFSAFMGMLLNLTFFLSATWLVRPFYFGADLPYLFGWLTLLLAGPGPWALDTVVRRWLNEQPLNHRGVPQPLPDSELMTRRAFVAGGAVSAAALVLAATGLGWGVLHRGSAGTAQSPSVPNSQLQTQETPTAPQAAQSAPQPAQAPQPAAPTEAPTQAPAAAPTTDTSGRQLLASAGQVPVGQAAEFTLPDGYPAVLVHNDQGYSAYIAVCTHQACVVQPADANTLFCPCHGSEFDVSASGQGQPIRGPARRPLSPVPIVVGSDGNVYLSQQ